MEFDPQTALECARKLARIHDANDIAQDAYLEWVKDTSLTESRAVWFAYANWRDKNRRKRVHARLIADPAKNEPLWLSPELLIPQELLPVAHGLLAGLTVQQIARSLRVGNAKIIEKIDRLQEFLTLPSR